MQSLQKKNDKSYKMNIAGLNKKYFTLFYDMIDFIIDDKNIDKNKSSKF